MLTIIQKKTLKRSLVQNSSLIAVKVQFENLKKENRKTELDVLPINDKFIIPAILHDDAYMTLVDGICKYFC